MSTVDDPWAIDTSEIANRQHQMEEDDARRKASGSYEFLKLSEGVNVIRILPVRAPRRVPFVEFKISYQVGPKNRSVTPLGQFGKECPLEKEITRLRALGDEVSKKKADKMFPKTRFCFWAIKRGEHDKGPQLLNVNSDQWKQIMSIIMDPQYGNITHPINGVDLNAVYTPGEKTKNGFAETMYQPRRNSEPLGSEDEMKLWLAEDLFDKYEIGKPSEAGYIQACIDGTHEEYLKQRRESGESVNAPSEANQSQAPATAPSAPSAPSATPIVKYDGAPTDQFWAAHPTTNAVQQMSVEQIGNFWLVNENFVIMSLDQKSGWVSPSALKFSKVVPQAAPAAPPAAPPGPPSAPSPPGPPSGPMGNVNQSEADKLKAQIDALQQARGGSTTSQVRQDLEAELRG